MFGSAVTYGTGSIVNANAVLHEPFAYGGPYLATGDPDGDCDADLGVPIATGVSILRNNGNGTFAPFASYPGDGASWGVAIGDVDNDGDADVVTANHNNDSISVLTNNGDASFAAPITCSAVFASPDGLYMPLTVALGDLDEDADLDVAVGTWLYDQVPGSHGAGACLDIEAHDIRITKGWFAAGADVNCGNGVAYSPFSSCMDASDVPRIEARDLDEKLSRTYPVSRKYHLSSDRTRLLLSTSDTEEQPTLAFLQLEDGKETVLPVSGALASWAGPETIVFIRSSRDLWRYRIGDERPARLMTVDGELPESHSVMSMRTSYAMAPVCSTNGSWVCWQYAIKSPQGFSRNGTVLIDLSAGQYRRLDDLWWHSVAWGK